MTVCGFRRHWESHVMSKEKRSWVVKLASRDYVCCMSRRCPEQKWRHRLAVYPWPQFSVIHTYFVSCTCTVRKLYMSFFFLFLDYSISDRRYRDTIELKWCPLWFLYQILSSIDSWRFRYLSPFGWKFGIQLIVLGFSTLNTLWLNYDSKGISAVKDLSFE